MTKSKGKAYVSISLRALGFDKQIRKLEQFDENFKGIFGPAIAEAVELSRKRAVELSPNGVTGSLDASIKGLMMSPTKTMVRGRIIAGQGMAGKAFAIERGRYYGTVNRHFWKGKFYMHFGVKDNKEEIQKIYKKASELLVGAMAIKASDLTE